jgi:hypothetical protein
MIKNMGGIISRIAGKPQNNEAAVLNAGWTAMQKADPNLAGAVQRMPPEVARGVVFQYTNAVREGKDADASNMAMQFAREQLAAYAQNNPQSNKPTGPIRFRLGGSSGGSSSTIGSADAFEKFMASPTPFQKPQSNTSSNPRNAMFSKLFSRIAAQRNPAPKNPQEAFDKVRNQYQAFNQSNWGEYEKNLVWDRPQDRELTKPANWNPSGLIASNMGTNPFEGY